jgi:subtilisin family serine protease
VIVRFAPAADAGDRARARAAVDAKVRDNLSFGVPGLQVLELGGGGSVEAAIDQLDRRPDVLYAEPNYIAEAAAVPNDSRFPEQWALHNTGQAVNGGPAGTPDADIDAPEAWDAVRDAGDVTVAVVDDGSFYDHPDLAANTWQNPGEVPENGLDDDANGFVDDHRGWDFVNDGPDPAATSQHGTNVGSVIAAHGDNDAPGPGTTDVAGVAWRAKLMNLRVMNASGRGKASDVTAAFLYAARMGVRVVNASLGGLPFVQSMHDAIAAAPNTLFVIAAGNSAEDVEGPSARAYPCKFTPANVVCVAATDQNDALTSFSNFGATSVDLAAPGIDNLTADPGDRQHSIPNEGFETGGGWVTGGTPNTWAVTDEVARVGTFSLTDSPGADYANSADNWARTSSAFDLTGRRRCAIQYGVRARLRFNFDTGPLVYEDRLLVEGATNPDGTWTPLGELEDLSGESFIDWGHDLGALSGQSSVYVRFRLKANDDNKQWDGVHIDQVRMWCFPSGFDADSYGFFTGTSAASPHAAGVAALLLGRFPEAGAGDVRDAMLAGVDQKAALGGKVATGGRLNARGALNAIDPDADSRISRLDNCPTVPNQGQENLDGDGGGDDCDGDDDNDGHADSADNCARAPNPDQADADLADGGDACDGDDDNDGRLDGADACPLVAAATADGCPLPPPPDPTLPTDGPDTLLGTAGGDLLCGLLGNDTISGLAGNDTIFGDACNDRAKLFAAQLATDGNDNLSGDDGNDRLYGAGGRDALRGGPGRDKLFGGDGDDRLDGGDGKDALDGGRGNDKLTGGRDTNSYKGGPGNDSVKARNGKRETVDCGSGRKDSATLDRADRAKRCERVKRPKP